MRTSYVKHISRPDYRSPHVTAIGCNRTTIYDICPRLGNQNATWGFGIRSFQIITTSPIFQCSNGQPNRTQQAPYGPPSGPLESLIVLIGLGRLLWPISSKYLYMTYGIVMLHTSGIPTLCSTKSKHQQPKSQISPKSAKLETRRRWMKASCRIVGPHRLMDIGFLKYA